VDFVAAPFGFLPEEFNNAGQVHFPAITQRLKAKDLQMADGIRSRECCLQLSSEIGWIMGV
jgi:hypothetical protein